MAETQTVHFSKLMSLVKNAPNWPELIEQIKIRSYSDKYNYLSLIEESILVQHLKIDSSSYVTEFFTQWLHKFKPDEHKSVNALIKTFYDMPFSDYGNVPDQFLKENVYHYSSNEIHLLDNNIIRIGQYCNHGVLIPRDFGSIIFNQLYNCTPTISLIKGDQEYISFLHTWAVGGSPNIVDMQVKHWMQSIAEIGDIIETIFAPRLGSSSSDTHYLYALEYLQEHSKKTIIFNRNLDELQGVVNKDGVYFQDCGYHLWGS
ncbi:MAG: hypothetical protein ACP5N2_03830 [Candidatus Nanoarchaeia archaeon]